MLKRTSIHIVMEQPSGKGILFSPTTQGSVSGQVSLTIKFPQLSIVALKKKNPHYNIRHIKSDFYEFFWDNFLNALPSLSRNIQKGHELKYVSG